MCATGLSAVMHVVQEKSLDLFRQLLAYLNKKKPSISSSDCIKLLQATESIKTTAFGRLAAFTSVVYALSRDRRQVPASTELADTLISYAEQYEWTVANDPVKAYTRRLQKLEFLSTDNSIMNLCFFVKVYSSLFLNVR